MFGWGSLCGLSCTGYSQLKHATIQQSISALAKSNFLRPKLSSRDWTAHFLTLLPMT
jgi:hypothetical protein